MGAAFSRGQNLYQIHQNAFDKAQLAVESELQKQSVNPKLLAELIKARDIQADVLKRPTWTWEVKFWLFGPPVFAGTSAGDATAPPAARVSPAAPAAAAAPAQIQHWNVLRLEDGGSTVGSACLVRHGRRVLLLTARHCLDPRPGKRIRVGGYSVLGHPVSHVASFPTQDVTVLQLDGGRDSWPKQLQDAPPFELAGSMGIRQDMPITLIGYPLAADDKPVRGFERPLTPLVAQGKVAWLTDDAEEAVGTYAGALPNSSGGAVALGPPYYFLAGLHVGAFWHEAGQRRQDATAAEDQGRPTVGPPGAGGARAACAVVMETDTWSSAAVGGLAARAACGRTSKHQQELKGGSSSANPSKPVRRPGAQQQPQVDEVARDQVLQQCLEDVEYCVANVEHKGQMAVFVPAAMLARLLKCCPGA